MKAVCGREQTLSFREKTISIMRLAGLTLLMLMVAFPLAGCNILNQSSPQALPTVVLDQSGVTPQAAPPGPGSGVVASGNVVPAQQARMAFAAGGRVKSVLVEAGDQVEAGQTLVVLEGQENLQAALSNAQFELEQAQQALKDLTTQAETARVQAMQEIVTYQQAVRDAQYALDNFTIPSNQEGMDAVEGLQAMKAELDKTRLAFEPYKSWPSGNQTRKDLKEALDLAQADYNTAVKRLRYEYDLQAAEAQLAQAQDDYATLKSGPDPDKVRLAQARVDNVQTRLAAAQAALEDLALLAPFGGTISELNIHAGEWVIPGQAILLLVDVAHLRIETSDLSERDIPQVAVGQPVMVYVKALNLTAPGKVSAIAPLADTLGGDVVYKTTIDLDELPDGLRAGMSVEVQFGVSP